MTDSESAQFWYEKYRREQGQTNQLTVLLRECKQTADAHLERAKMEAKRFAREQERLEKLRASHVRAVNSVGAGLEPVSDQSFMERLRELHHEVSMVRMWRRGEAD